jgi:hypothetical protein
VWVWERSGSVVPGGRECGGKQTGNERECGASGNDREHQKQVGSAIREGRSVGGSAIPGRSHLERGSGVRTGGGGDASATRDDTWSYLELVWAEDTLCTIAACYHW